MNASHWMRNAAADGQREDGNPASDGAALAAGNCQQRPEQHHHGEGDERLTVRVLHQDVPFVTRSGRGWHGPGGAGGHQQL